MRPFGRQRHRHEDKLDIKETEREYVDWIYVAQDRVQLRVFVDTIMNIHIP
jgi:hypothetical protein